jgi:hypothetical protein
MDYREFPDLTYNSLIVEQCLQLNCRNVLRKTSSIPILMHQMQISTNFKSLFNDDQAQKVGNLKNVYTVKEPIKASVPWTNIHNISYVYTKTIWILKTFPICPYILFVMLWYVYKLWKFERYISHTFWLFWTQFWTILYFSITLYGDVTIASEGLQNFGLCSVLKAFEQGGIFIVPAVTRYLSFPGLIRRTSLFSRLLLHTRECGGSILTLIFTNLQGNIYIKEMLYLQIYARYG